MLRTLILGVLVGTTLPANDLDVFLSFGLLSPQKNVSNQTVDAFGQTTGQVFQAAENFKMAGLGVSYTLLNLGDFRIRGEAEYGTSVQNPGATLRYLAPGVTDQYVEAEGTLKARSAQVGLTATYVSSGAGEYGVTFEERFDTLDFDITQATVSFPGQETVITGQTLSKTFTDPFLSLHATFVQHYTTFALFSRLGYGMVLGGSRSPGSFPEQSYRSLDNSLLEVLRPRQEIKLSLGTRF